MKENFAVRAASSDGLSYKCKDCIALNNKAYYTENASVVIKKVKANYNAEEKKIYNKAYNKNNRVKINAQRKEYHKNNKTNVKYILTRALRIRLNKALKGNFKSGSAIKDLGCSIEQLKQWLESQFETGMTWENYGNKQGQWSIDHIFPLSKVDLTTKESLKKVCHWFNLRPMWHIENITRGNITNAC